MWNLFFAPSATDLQNPCVPPLRCVRAGKHQAGLHRVLIKSKQDAVILNLIFLFYLLIHFSSLPEPRCFITPTTNRQDAE